MECIWLDYIRDLLDWLNKNEKTFPPAYEGGRRSSDILIIQNS